MRPLKRATHTATLIDDKLYILGGYKTVTGTDEISGQQFFYLDVSEPFNTQALQWVDLVLLPGQVGSGFENISDSTRTIFS